MNRARGTALALALLAASCRVKETAAPEPRRDRLPLPEKKTEPVQVQEGPRDTFTSKRQLELEVDPSRTAGRKGVELWYTTDGANWINHGFSEASVKVVRFLAVRDARYQFVLVPVDKADRREFVPARGTVPDFSVVVDTMAPAVEVLSPNGGEVFRAGASTVVTWSAEDASLAPSSIRIEVSSAADSWVTIARDLPNRGTYHWDIPRTSSNSYRIRVVATDLAGNTGSDTSDAPFTVDGLAPEARITGPSVSIRRPAKIEFVAADLGGAGLRKITLWFSRDGGQSWQPHRDAEELSSPIPFDELDGVYGLALVAQDRVGNESPVPRSGSAPAWKLVVDSTPPQVKLLSPAAGATYLAESAIDVTWAVRDNIDLPQNAVSLYYSAEGGRPNTWQEIERNVPIDQPFRWKAPKKPGDKYVVKAVARDTAGNTAETTSDRFAIDETIPEARVVGPKTSPKTTVLVNYDFVRRGFGRITRVTLWYTPDGGAHWYKYDDDADLQSPMPFSKNDGTYGLYVVCSNDAGERSGVTQKAPVEGTEPQLSLVIDSTPPGIAIQGIKKGQVLPVGRPFDILWTLSEPHPDPKGLSVLFFDGEGWTMVAHHLDPSSGRYPWTVPRTPTKKGRIRLVAHDLFANRGEVESEEFTIPDEGKPDVGITLKGIVTGQELAAGSEVAISWETKDDTIREFQLELQKADPDRWFSLGSYRTRAVTFRVPLEFGRYGLRVTGVNAAKETVTSNVVHFVSTATMGTIRISVPDRVEPGETVRISILPSDLTRNVEAAWLQILEDQRWRNVVQIKDAAVTFAAPLQEGPYALRVYAKDLRGRELLSAEQPFRVSSRRRPSGSITLLNFQGGQVHLGGATKLIALSTTIPLSELRVMVSADSGRTWSEVPKGNLTPVTGGLMWKDLPTATGRTYRIRVVHETGSAQSASDFSIDSTPPGATVLGPARAEKTPVKLQVKLEESISKIVSVTLYTTRDGGRSWALHRVYPQPGDVTFAPPDTAEIGLYLCATSQVGLSSPDPRPGTTPQLTFRGATAGDIDGEVAIDTTFDPVVKGGTGVRIVWRGRCSDPRATVALYLVSDGTETPIERGLPVSGHLDWTIPREDRSRVRVRIAIEAGGQSKWGRASNEFSIDSTPPKITDVDVDR